jgi:hypothetical protein
MSDVRRPEVPGVEAGKPTEIPVAGGFPPSSPRC